MKNNTNHQELRIIRLLTKKIDRVPLNGYVDS